MEHGCFGADATPAAPIVPNVPLANIAADPSPQTATSKRREGAGPDETKR